MSEAAQEFYYVWVENGTIRQLHYGTDPSRSFRRITCSSLKIRHLPLKSKLLFDSPHDSWQCYLTSQAKAANLDREFGPSSWQGFTSLGQRESQY